MLLSIITINLNNLAGLSRTFESVPLGASGRWEWIVVDGGSTDGSKEFIEQRADRLAYWCSEADKGVYAAMNKGVQHAKGQYCLFLNSGDHLYNSKSLPLALRAAEECQDDGDIIAFDLIIDNDPLHKYVRVKDRLSEGFFLSNTLPHQSTLIKTELLRQMPYREDVKIVADWFFFFEQIAIRHRPYKAVHRPLAVFYSGGVSGNTQLRLREMEELLRRHYPAYAFGLPGSPAEAGRLKGSRTAKAAAANEPHGSMTRRAKEWIYNNILIYINFAIRKLRQIV
ncbi:MAG: glycosyltransferase family 2 protein [Alloprevotella sp.]